jgi:CubicO group peptidase (beta-lactamase class C family)
LVGHHTVIVGISEKVYWIRLDTFPAGDVYSTPSDMARFLIMHLNGGKYQDRQILSSKSVRDMATVQFAKNEGRFGLGWVVGKVKGRDMLWHNGAVEGFRSHMRIDPKNRLGVVLFANKFPEDYPLTDLANLAIALLGKAEGVACKVDRVGPGGSAAPRSVGGLRIHHAVSALARVGYKSERIAKTRRPPI